MLVFVTRRLIYAVLTFFGITIAIFLLIHLVPGDPVRFYLRNVAPGAHVSPALIAEIRHEHHLDRPVVVQYGFWLRDVTHFDFGRSMIDRRPVTERIAEKLPNTVVLNVIAFFIALLIAIPTGILSALKPNGMFDRGSGVVFFLLYSLPSFWVALLLMELLSVKLDILPLFGITSDEYVQMSFGEQMWDRTLHLVLPVVVLAYGQLAVFARFSRTALVDVMRQQYVVAARARGVSELRVVLRHAFRNALIPLITLLGLTLPYLLSGSVIVERIFQWDGVGLLYFDAILARDYPTVMGLTVVTAIATLVVSLVADLLYGAADPRIRVGER